VGARQRLRERQAGPDAEAPDVREDLGLLAIREGSELVGQDVLGGVEPTENGMS
jgi:hypothetical protein